MQTSQLQTGIAIQQQTQGDSNFYLPDGTLATQKFTPQALVSLTNYDAIVGPSLSSTVLYTSVQTAINNTAVDGRILILPGTYAGAVTLNYRVFLVGQGYGTFINGTFTCQSGCIYTSLHNFRCSQFIFNSGANGNVVSGCFVTTASSDSGTGNGINEMVL